MIWIGAFFLLVAVWALWTYNSLIRARNKQAEAWSGVEVQLKKRHDLIPSLVTCVKGYQTHESEVFNDVAKARANNDESGVVKGLRNLIALAEAYPELKASENFRQLTLQLVAVEDDLQYARRYYNGAVRDFRNLAESFPSNLMASLGHFQTGAFFEVESAIERSAPSVEL